MSVKTEVKMFTLRYDKVSFIFKLFFSTFRNLLRTDTMSYLGFSGGGAGVGCVCVGGGGGGGMLICEFYPLLFWNLYGHLMIWGGDVVPVPIDK